MSAAVRCTHCRRLLRLDFAIGRIDGRVTESAEFCGCPGSRREARICTYCELPVDGPRSRYCGDECRGRAAREQQAKFRASPKGKKALKKQNRARRTKLGRAKRRIQEREYRSQPEVRERRKKMRRRAYLSNHERYLEHRRLYRERYPDRVREQQRSSNAKRAAAKREHMHRYCTKYVGPGKSPTCRSCGGVVPFDGVGRPILECRDCDPKRWAQRDRRRQRAQEKAAA